MLSRLQTILVDQDVHVTHTGNDSLLQTKGRCVAVHEGEGGSIDIELHDGNRLGLIPDEVNPFSVEGRAVAPMTGRRKVEIVS